MCKYQAATFSFYKLFGVALVDINFWANHASVPGPIGDLLKASKSRDMCELKFLSKNPKNAKKNYAAAIRDLLKSIKMICPNRKLN